MRPALLEILVCPGCGDGPLSASSDSASSGEIASGTLTCNRCRIAYPIRAGIPRFVESHKTDASFGHQWNLFRREQLDSSNGAGFSANRLWSETGWTADGVAGRRILDVGCGAGRFLEIISKADCQVVGVDISSAIDASAITVRDRPNVDLVQADIYRLPFRAGSFDACYCIGVAQHTPDPLRALASLPRVIRPGGALAVAVYERKPWTLLNTKYLIRPLTRRMNKRLLLAMITWTMPVLFPITEVLFRVPLLGRAFDFVIPVANYVYMHELTWRQRYRMAILDTFDRLAPDFDGPMTEGEVRNALAEAGIEGLQRLSNSGVNVIGNRKS